MAEAGAYNMVGAVEMLVSIHFVTLHSILFRYFSAHICIYVAVVFIYMAVVFIYVAVVKRYVAIADRYVEIAALFLFYTSRRRGSRLVRRPRATFSQAPAALASSFPETSTS